MRTPRPTAALLLATALLSTVLTACADDPPPPSPPDSPTAPATPRPTLPPISERSQEFTADGAASFVAYYVSLLDYASKTGDVQELTRVSDPDCGGCQDYIDFYRQIHDAGGKIDGRQWSVGRTQLRLASDPKHESRATTRVTIAAGTVQKDSRSAAEQASKSRHVITFGLQYEVEWIMTQLVAGDPS